MGAAGADLSGPQGLTLVPRRLPASAIGIVGEELLLTCVAAEATGALSALRGRGGLCRSLWRCFAALGCADLSPATVTRLAERIERLGEAAAPRVTEVARLYARYRSLLSAGGAKVDAALAYARGVGDPSGGIPAADAIVVHDLHRLPAWDHVPTPYGALSVLANACAAAGEGAVPGSALRVVLPRLEPDDAPPPALDQALRPLLDALYARHTLNIEIDWAPLGPALADGAEDSAWGRFVRGLFAPAGGDPLLSAEELDDATLTIAAHASPAVEARSVAARVHALLAGGTSADQIGIVVEDPARQARMVTLLLRYGVPVQVVTAPSGLGGPGSTGAMASLPPEGRADLPPPIALLLSLYDLLAQGLPREGLLHVIASSYVDLPGVEAADQEGGASYVHDVSHLCRALRGAGVRAIASTTGNAAGGERGAADEVKRRVTEWLRQQKPVRGAEGGSGAAGEPPELRQLAAILRELESLPGEATVRAHAHALQRLCERLRFDVRMVGFVDGVGDSARLCAQGDVDVDDDPRARLASDQVAGELLALARDQAAWAVLSQALQELPARAEQLRLRDVKLSQARFATLLRSILRRLWLGAQTPGCGGAAVEVGGLMDLSVRPRRVLICAGLVEGELPGGVAEDPLLSDDDRALCNRLLGAAIFPLSRQAGDAMALRFVELLAHAEGAMLTWARTDEEGRPLLPSTFVDAALRAAGRDAPGQREATDEGGRIPSPQAARHDSELWLWSAPAFLRAGAGAGAASGSQELLAALLSRRDRGRRNRLSARLDAERARATWFAALSAQAAGTGLMDVQPGPQSGRLCDGRLIAQLLPRLPGDARRPLSASALEDYARCPFRFFVYRVLQAAPMEEGGDDLDPLTSGRLHHRVLELFFANLRDRGRLPLRGDDEERTLLDEVIAEVLREFDTRERTGHPALFRARMRRLRADLRLLIAREAKVPIAPGCVPTLLEHPFGPLRIAARDDVGDGDDALHITGIIDRIDIGPGRAVVIDYKTGQMKRYQDYLRNDLLVTSFQLPLYAAAVRVDPKVAAAAGMGEVAAAVPRVTAHYYAVRQAMVTLPLDDEKLFALDAQTRATVGEHNVAEAAYRLWRQLRGGDFRVAPRSCDGCGLESVCRIGTAAVERGEALEAGAESESSSGVTPAMAGGASSASVGEDAGGVGAL